MQPYNAPLCGTPAPPLMVRRPACRLTADLPPPSTCTARGPASFHGIGHSRNFQHRRKPAVPASSASASAAITSFLVLATRTSLRPTGRRRRTYLRHWPIGCMFRPVPNTRWPTRHARTSIWRPGIQWGVSYSYHDTAAPHETHQRCSANGELRTRASDLGVPGPYTFRKRVPKETGLDVGIPSNPSLEYVHLRERAAGVWVSSGFWR